MAELSRPIDKEFNVEVEGGRFSTDFLYDLVDTHVNKIAPRYIKFQKLYEGKHKIQNRPRKDKNKCIIKERKMEKAIKELVRVLSVPIHVNTGREVDVLKLKVEFSRNVPNNLTEIVDTVTKLDGKVDKETLLSLLPFIDNPKEVLEKLEADKERDRQSTDPYSTQNITEDSNNLFPNLNAQNSPQEALNAQGATIPQPEQ